MQVRWYPASAYGEVWGLQRFSWIGENCLSKSGRCDCDSGKEYKE